MVKTSTCSCGKVNSGDTPFCSSCGSPLYLDNKNNLNVEPNHEVALGYSIQKATGTSSKDSLFMLDLKTLFDQDKHRIVLCIIVKGLANLINGQNTLNLLSRQILFEKSSTDHQKALMDLKASLEKEYSLALSNNTTTSKMGLLVSIIDNGKVSAMSLGGTRIMLTDGKVIKVINGTKNEPFIGQITIENGNYLLLSSIELTDYIQEKEILNSLTEASNPQAACDELTKLVKTKNSQENCILGIVKLIE
jgi:hypothetical protein